MSTKIDKLIIDIDGKQLELTPKQAKELHNILGEMFGSKTTYLPPIIIERPRIWPYLEGWTVTTGNTLPSPAVSSYTLSLKS